MNLQTSRSKMNLRSRQWKQADELRARIHQNQVEREANNQQLSGAERQAYVNEQLGGNEAKANAYQDDIYYKPGRGGGRA